MKRLDSAVFSNRARTQVCRLRLLLLASCLGSLLLSPVCAAELIATPTPNGFSASGSTLLAVIRLLGALAVVFGLFFGGLWLVRRYQGLALSQRDTRRLKVLERQALGQRHSLYVVGYDEQRVLIATSPAGVTMLTALPSAPPLQEQAALQSGTSPARASFINLLWAAMARQS